MGEGGHLTVSLGCQFLDIFSSYILIITVQLLRNSATLSNSTVFSIVCADFVQAKGI